MNIFIYDRTFDGLLACVFDAYVLKTFPDRLLGEGEPLPLFYDRSVTVVTTTEKHERVWRGLQKRLSPAAMTHLTYGWLSELPGIDLTLFRYMRKALDSPVSIETNFADTDVLELSKTWRKVSHERLRILQFVRFQKAADGTYFAAIAPQYNALPLAVSHFQDRFADQPWLIYDLKRRYGYYYDLKKVEEVTLQDTGQAHLVTGTLDAGLLSADEEQFQRLWQAYFKSICIKERLNPRKHRQDMPVRYWKYLTEKKGG